ncbi:MAG: (4Fe-4S)-binding protein [Deltaproteobacteria bacterium]|nr:MAG: (4Fe-4S)-binding protein [Deltaproteobacteria bacterium]
MIISIASGKGGTGKTTIATNLALSVEKAVFLDCDVEEPNAHLFLKPKIIERESVKIPVPEVDKSRCSLCGKCAEICQFKAIVVIGETLLTFHELCHGCGGCTRICPEKAVIEVEKEIGVIEKGYKDSIDFIHGRLNIGEPMSPPIIRKVRRYENKKKTTIIDAPPGTSCPVIASIKGADFVLLVTEPTPFGMHDLELAVGAVKMLGIPCGLVINRSDIGDDKVKRYAQEENIPILMEIPFDKRVAESYSKGVPLVEMMPEWRKDFLELYNKIEEVINERVGSN